MDHREGMMAAHNTSASSSSVAVRLPLVGVVLCLMALVVGALQLAIWHSGVNDRGGLDLYVARWTDYAPTLTGALIIADGDGDRLYNLDAQRAAQARITPAADGGRREFVNIYNHPPAEALFASLLLALPHGTIFTIWTIMSTMAFGAALWLLASAVQIRNPHRLVLIVFACTFYPTHLVHLLGQNTSFVLLGICGLYWAWVRQNETWMGVALVLIGLKPQIVPLFALLLILLRCWRALGTAAGIVVALTVATMPVLGVAWPISYTRYLLNVSNLGAVVAQHPQQMTNWRGMLINFSGDASGVLIAPVWGALAVITVGAIVWCALRVARQPTRGAAIGERSATLFACTVIAAILIAPHLNSHDLTLLIVPAWIIWGQIANGHWQNVSPWFWGALLLLVWLLPLLSFFGVFPEGVAVVANVLLVAGVGTLLLWRSQLRNSDHDGQWFGEQAIIGGQ